MIPYSLDEMHELATKVIGQSISVPGVQPKITLNTFKAAGAKNYKLTIVNYPGAFILKPQSYHYSELPENEDLTMKLARASGIATVPSCLAKLESGQLAYISARIDRRNSKKIHMEDFCQVSGRLTEDKYKGSVENIAKIIYKNSDNMMFDVIRFFELVLFSFIIGNSDMHLKNYSFIYLNDQPGLAPAYDLLNTKIVLPDDLEESALTINGKKNRIRIEDFNAFAKKCRIPDSSLQNIYNSFSKLKQNYINIISRSFLSEEKKEAYCRYVIKQYDNLRIK